VHSQSVTANGVIPPAEAAIPVVEALGRHGASPAQGPSDRGGAIPIATADLLAERLAAASAAHAAYEAEAKARLRLTSDRRLTDAAVRDQVAAVTIVRTTLRWREVDSNHRFSATVSFVKPQNHLLFAGTGADVASRATALTRRGIKPNRGRI